MTKGLLLTGKIVSGTGEGSYFTLIDWVQQQCNQKLGFKPCAGTLNLEVSGCGLSLVESLDPEEEIKLISPDPRFCNAKVFPVSLGEIKAAIVVPEEKARIHPQNIIEIVAPINIKTTLHVKDGDTVTLFLKV